MVFNQHEFDIRLEWGLNGIRELAPISDVVIIIDVLSFSTCVDIACGKGAIIYPYQWKDETAKTYAQEVGADLADVKRTRGYYSLSPSSLVNMATGTKLVLPSPNGSTLSLSTGQTPTLCGCLRNAKAVAECAMRIGKKIALIPAGEQWPDGSLRPATEDLVGAGAIIAHLKGVLSPESMAALAAYKTATPDLVACLKQCSSGKELIERGFEEDVELASELNISSCVPLLKGNFYAEAVN